MKILHVELARVQGTNDILSRQLKTLTTERIKLDQMNVGKEREVIRLRKELKRIEGYKLIDTKKLLKQLDQHTSVHDTIKKETHFNTINTNRVKHKEIILDKMRVKWRTKESKQVQYLQSKLAFLEGQFAELEQMSYGKYYKTKNGVIDHCKELHGQVLYYKKEYGQLLEVCYQYLPNFQQLVDELKIGEIKPVRSPMTIKHQKQHAKPSKQMRSQSFSGRKRATSSASRRFT